MADKPEMASISFGDFQWVPLRTLPIKAIIETK